MVDTFWDDLLIHTASLYAYRPGQDPDAGSDGSYVPVQTGVRCWIENQSSDIVSFQDSSRMVNFYTCFFPPGTMVGLKDRIDHIDDQGFAHRIFVSGLSDFSAQGGLVEVAATDLI